MPAEHKAILRHRQHLAEVRGHEVSYEETLADWLEHHAVNWRQARLASYLAKQREEMDRHKWIESEKANRDLGREAVLDWIAKHAAEWRDWYESHLDEAGELDSAGVQ